MTRRHALLAAGILLLAILLTAYGRWEGRRAVQGELDGMREILALVGPSLERRVPTAYRPAEQLACLIYQTSKLEPFGIELCFARDGRLVETIDRRGSGIHAAGLREQPEASDIRFDVATILAALRRASPERFGPDVTELAVGGPDLGPISLMSR